MKSAFIFVLHFYATQQFILLTYSIIFSKMLPGMGRVRVRVRESIPPCKKKKKSLNKRKHQRKIRNDSFHYWSWVLLGMHLYPITLASVAEITITDVLLYGRNGIQKRSKVHISERDLVHLVNREKHPTTHLRDNHAEVQLFLQRRISHQNNEGSTVWEERLNGALAFKQLLYCQFLSLMNCIVLGILAIEPRHF